MGCVNGDDYGTPDLSNDCVTIATSKSVKEYNKHFYTTTVHSPLLMLTDYIEAYVTSSDEGGNFYKSISMMSLDGLQRF